MQQSERVCVHCVCMWVYGTSRKRIQAQERVRVCVMHFVCVCMHSPVILGRGTHTIHTHFGLSEVTCLCVCVYLSLCLCLPLFVSVSISCSLPPQLFTNVAFVQSDFAEVKEREGVREQGVKV